MQRTVHILNGDSTTFGIKEGGILGDCIIWREMLTEGALSKDVGSDDFWTKRYTFFEDEFGINKLEYYDKTIKELIQIEDLSNYYEVVLWFEFDLFCQVNLMALCTYLLTHYRKDINYYLVCTGKEKGEERLQTLSDYPPKHYRVLLENKIKLSRNDLLFTKECWELYVMNNQSALKAFNFAKNKKFKYFQLAINQHLKRFSDANELNEIDTKILTVINAKALTEKEIIKELLIWQRNNTVYGFGDIQYLRYLRRLADLYEIRDDKYYLNNKGKSFIVAI